MQFEFEFLREALGLGKDALTAVIAIIGIYSSLAARPGRVNTPEGGSGLKFGFEIPGIGALFWKRG